MRQLPRSDSNATGAPLQRRDVILRGLCREATLDFVPESIAFEFGIVGQVSRRRWRMSNTGESTAHVRFRVVEGAGACAVLGLERAASKQASAGGPFSIQPTFAVLEAGEEMVCVCSFVPRMSGVASSMLELTCNDSISMIACEGVAGTCGLSCALPSGVYLCMARCCRRLKIVGTRQSAWLRCLRGWHARLE